MTCFARLTLAAAALALSLGGASAQIYPLTNGPNGTGPNTVDSAKGFDGINAVAPEREFLYHPERQGNAAAQLGITADPQTRMADEVAPARPQPRHRRRHAPRR